MRFNIKNLFNKASNSTHIPFMSAMMGRLSINDPTAKSAIEQGYKYNPDVFSIVSYLTQKSKLPKWEVGIKEDGQFDKIDTEFKSILERPNPFLTWSDFIEQIIGYKKIAGDYFVYAPRIENGNNKGQLIPGLGMYIIPPQFVTIDIDGNFPKYEYKYKIFNQSVPTSEIIHGKYFNPISSQNEGFGLSPIVAGRLAVSRNSKNYEASVKLFDNLGAIGILSGNQSVADQQLTKPQAQAVEEKLTAKISGPKNFGKWVVTAANLKWLQLGQNAGDLKLIEDRKMGLREICNLYHVNSAIFNDPQNKTYNNLQEAKKAVYTDVIMPDLEAITSDFTPLLRAYNDKASFKINYSDIPELQIDKSKLVTWLNTAWWLTGARKQELMGEEIDESLNFYLIPNGQVQLGEDIINEEDLEKFYKLLNDGKKEEK